MTQRQPRHTARRGPGTLTVVFVDDCRWNAFHQLAPRLRRAGVRTVRVSTEGLTRTKVSSRLLFDRYALAAGPDDIGPLRDVLSSENVVDVQFAESLGPMVGELSALLPPSVAEHVGRRLEVVDKLAAAARFSAAGVRTPAVLRLVDASREDAVERFGFPLVVKDRVGFGGERVAIADNLDDLALGPSTWGSEEDDLYFEQFVTGTKLNYGAVVSDTGIEQELVYRITEWKRPVGRATEIETLDDPQLVALGRQAIEASRCTGFVNMDVIRDGDGVDWLIDFNARAFGGSGSFMAVGTDTCEGYLRVIGARTDPLTGAPPPAGARIRIFPTCLEAVISTGKPVRTTAAFLRASAPYLRWLGLRYWLSEALLTADWSRRARKEAGTTRRAATAAGPMAPTISEMPAR